MFSKHAFCLETFSTEFTFLHSGILHVVTSHAVKTRFLFGSSQHRSHISLFLDLHRIPHYVVFLGVFRSILLFQSFLHDLHNLHNLNDLQDLHYLHELYELHEKQYLHDLYELHDLQYMTCMTARGCLTCMTFMACRNCMNYKTCMTDRACMT